MEQNYGDLSVSGAGSVGGGKYNNVKISGAGNINGDIECTLFRSSGASETKGNVNAKIIEISGASDIKGNVEAEEIKISGASNIKGNVTTKKIRVSGASEIKGSLHAEEIEIRGAIDIKEDCEAETFSASGGFDIGGLLNAGNIEIRVHGKCRVREIGGEKIDVRKDDGSFLGKVMSVFSLGEKLITGIIEGDEIYLENTNAKIVRGNNVIIGPNCNIETIEYRNSINVDASSKVNSKRIE